jgi:hypothetical protein
VDGRQLGIPENGFEEIGVIHGKGTAISKMILGPQPAVGLMRDSAEISSELDANFWPGTTLVSQ